MVCAHAHVIMFIHEVYRELVPYRLMLCEGLMSDSQCIPICAGVASCGCDRFAICAMVVPGSICATHG